MPIILDKAAHPRMSKLYMKLTDCQLTELKRLMISSGKKHNLPNAAIVISESGEIIGASESLVATNLDATAHAERLVISKVCKKEKSPTIPHYNLIAVLEPCLMCISAAYWAGIKNIYFIIPSSRYYDKLPWITESKKLKKAKVVAWFEERIGYYHLEKFEKEFVKIFDQFVNKVIKRIS